MKDSIIVCRCEDVTVKDVKAAISKGAHTPNDIKRLTRCGSGVCQAKICSDLMVEMIHETTGKSYGDIGIHCPRMPIRPVVLSTLLTGGDAGEDI